jgi:hypothetical protein
MHQSRRTTLHALLLTLTTLAGCAVEEGRREPPPARPADVRAQIASLLPANLADRQGWATDIYAALAALEIRPTAPNICAVLAITEQESTFSADPPVPNLGRIAWEEIDRRAERMGIPKAAVHLALKLDSPTGKSYGERLDAAKTEGELSRIFEDFIGMVPLGERLFARLNPVRTGGPMQVGLAFAEKQVKERPYPYPTSGSIRHEVFTRRGGLYFGAAHLLDYPVAYDRYLYRFADFNAGRYASRNAAFQSAVSLISGIPVDLDGDLIVPGRDADKPGSTELAVRSIARQLDMNNDTIRRALEKEEGAEFERTSLYRKVFELADRLERKPVPRAVVPRIELHSPKITRKLTTEWFAHRVDERHRRCLAKASSPASASTGPGHPR